MKDIMWTLLGQGKPAVNQSRRLEFVKAFERLLLASTSGAFFFALARNIPVHAKEVAWPPDWIYTIDRGLRYVCLTWFLAYFFVSATNNDLSKASRYPKDVIFDVLQSIAVLSATYGLGFVIPDRGFAFEDGLVAFRFADIVICGICLLSLCLFGKGASVGLNRARITGVLVALVAVGVSFATRTRTVLLWLLLLHLLLWAVWWAYFCLRRDSDS
jgi:hypothetical protein